VDACFDKKSFINEKSAPILGKIGPDTPESGLDG
jgi:hypothetical protein